MNTKKSISKKLVSAVLIMAMLVIMNCAAVFAADGNTTVYTTKTGKCYHTLTCRTLKSCIPTTLEAASKRYSPCGVCHPPVLTDAPVGIGTGSGKGAAAAPGFVWCSVGDACYHKVNQCGTTTPVNALNVSEKDAKAALLTPCKICFK